MNDDLTAKLERFKGHVQARAADIRQRLGPGLAVAETTRETFNARLVWFEDRQGEIGYDYPPSYPYNFTLRLHPNVPRSHDPDRDSGLRDRRKSSQLQSKRARSPRV